MPIPMGTHQTASLLKFVVICAIASSNHGAWPDVRLDHCDPELRLRFDVLLSAKVVRLRSVTLTIGHSCPLEHAVEARDDADDRNFDARETVGRGGKN
jgi:hypothetical protein